MSADNAKMIADAIEAWRQSERLEKIERYRHLNRVARKGQILFCGSSLMEQFPVQELLIDLNTSMAIYNRGVGGFTTKELAEYLDTLVFDLEPSHIFINIGTNDLNAEDYHVQGLISRYEDILQRIMIRLPEAKIYVMAYYPCNWNIGIDDPDIYEHFHFRTNERITEANAAVRQLAEKLGVQFLELNNGITDVEGNMKEEYTVEGIHMHGDGYLEILKQMMPILKEIAAEKE